MADQKDKPGPKPERVKIDENWEEAVKKALKKKRPKEGWPKDDDSQKSKLRESKEQLDAILSADDETLERALKRLSDEKYRSSDDDDPHQDD